MNRKRIIRIVAVVVLFAVAATWLAPMTRQLLNMRSEYMAAGVIRELETFVRINDGKWPTSEREFPGDRDVAIDYSVTSEQLIANPNRLRAAIRPRSGKFLTYPHYEQDLQSLLHTLRETQTDEAAR